MIKNFIIISIILFTLSCSASITDPNESENAGNGSFIHPDIAITDQETINKFLEQHNGIYYASYEDGSLNMRYIIEGSEIYSGYGTQIKATRTLFGNKLQIYIEGKSSGTGAGYEMNDEMYTFNFGSDGNIYLFANAIFHKEPYESKKGYSTKIGEAISELITYSGNYYYYDYDDTLKYYILIDQNGQVYIDDNFKITYSKTELKNNVLILTYLQTGGTSSKQELHFYDKDGSHNYKLIFGNTWINNQLQYEKLKRYDIFRPYNGTYSEGSTTLTISSTNASITGVTSGTPVMSGNTLIIYQYSSRYPTKVHKFIFSDNKQTVTYIKPDGNQSILTRK